MVSYGESHRVQTNGAIIDNDVSYINAFHQMIFPFVLVSNGHHCSLKSLAWKIDIQLSRNMLGNTKIIIFVKACNWDVY
jgi:hypothetical protein